MEKKQIIQGNKLIAEFMGYEHDTPEDETESVTYNCNDFLVNISSLENWNTTDEDWTSYLLPSEMLFHSSWDWLIPVIDEILSSKEYLEYKKTLSIYNSGVFVNTKFIEVSFDSVVEYIKWYNCNIKNV